MDKDLEKLRHSTSHILATAVKRLYPNAKLGIGPAIEDGFYYDFDNLNIKEQDLIKIENEMQKIIKENQKFQKKEVSKKDAENLFKNEPYKLELLKEIDKPTIYTNGSFTDLCSGPHINSTNEIKAFKLLSIAGAYWKGSSSNKMLTRIYGIAFKTQNELKEFLHLKEEAEKRNHIKLGKQLNLFSFHSEAPGFPFWHPKGIILKNELIKFWRDIHEKAGYKEIQTPMILNRQLWETSGHWSNYKENMYFTRIDEQDFAVKPMNCPGGILLYKENLYSYKKFPLRIAELGLVHRHEISGVLNGLFRVRAFTQDDAHIYCLPEQIEDEVNNIINLVKEVYSTLGFKEYFFEISTRPEKYVGSEKMWDLATIALKNVLKKRKIKYEIDEGAGVFYGPKIDIKIKDSLGRKWQCATIQYDFNLPERFDLTYEGKDGQKHRPIMLHRVVYGSLERIIGILIEHYAGKFPLWLAPVQVKILTLSEKNNKFAKNVLEKLKENNIRTELDSRNESISKKVREAQLEKINKIVVIGDKEEKSKSIALRDAEGKIKVEKLDKFIKDCLKEIQNKL